MAPRRRRAAAQAPPAEERSDDSEALSDVGSASPAEAEESAAACADGTTLRFDESLLGRPGRPIPVGTLLKRLQKLSEELKSLEQDVSEQFKEACRPVAKELGDNSILVHKDKGVRAWAGQCIVDILALCAPDAPFSLQQLKAIFEMFVKTIFPALADPANAYNLQHIYILESLANVKSILLITDLSNSNKLMIQLFTTFFDIYSGAAQGSTGGDSVSKHVEYTMLNTLVTLVDEAEALPQEVVDMIISQFLRADPRLSAQKEQKTKKGEKADDKQTTLVRRELPTPYIMAKDICNMVPEKMAREVSKYFSEVLLEASGSNLNGARGKSGGDAEDAEDAEMGLSEEDLSELDKAHRLIRELWRACPSVLQNVIPQLEAELSAENVQLRALAVETIGDLISGIGAAGPPPNTTLDASAYPPLSFSEPLEPPVFDPMTTPKAPQPFSQAHSQAYSSFLSRRQDKSLVIRAAWTTAIGRILTTNAGGVGIGSSDERRLVEDLARMLNDADEKVRLAAVKAIGAFTFQDAITKLGSIGGVDQLDSISVFANLAARVKDRKPVVRAEAMTVLARLWGVAHGEIAKGNEQVKAVVGGIPSHLFNTFYINSAELFELLDKAIFEELVPLNYPPIKSKSKDKANGSLAKTKDGQANDKESQEQDADAIRAERIILLVHGLDERAKKVFENICLRQASVARFFDVYLQACESYNGGVMGKDEKEITERLARIVKAISEFYPEQQRVSSDLHKFAKMHDRRSYQLLRFCMDAKSDYKTVKGAVRELNKRISESAHPSLLETLNPCIYRFGLMIYNRSHVPTILNIQKTDEKGLASTAHELLKDMSSRNPQVLESHIRDMCQSLQDDIPSATNANSSNAVDNLKACAAYARKFPQKLPQDRKFVQAMSSFTTFGSPPEAGKHAVSIILTASPRKELMAKETVQKCIKGFKYGEPGFLTRLASMSQLMLLAPKETEEYTEAIFDIALKEILAKRRSSSPDSDYVWQSEMDEECKAKVWAIRIITNRIRSHSDVKTLAQVAGPVYSTLMTLVADEGEISPIKDTPAEHKPQLRLAAAISLFKLCRGQKHDALLDPVAFEKLAEVMQDRLFEVRAAILGRLKKYLSRNTLPSRFYTIPFLMAYEPSSGLRPELMTWLKQRRMQFANQAAATPVNDKSQTRPKAPTTMEAVIPRLISLLAHHPDYEDTDSGLKETARYIIFYLQCVASEQNVSLIYHLAQRVKNYSDVVLITSKSSWSEAFKRGEPDCDFDTRLYTLSDLSCALIRAYVELHDWSVQTLPGEVNLPASLFREIRKHDESANIAEKDFLTESLRDSVDNVVRTMLRKKAKTDSRKRKSEAVAAAGDDDDDAEPKKAKRSKRSGSGKTKSGKKQQQRPRRRGDGDSGDEGGSRRNARDLEAEQNRRKSGRASNAVKYIERDDSEDDEEMLGGVAEWEYENGERWKEPGSSTDGSDGESDDRDEDEDEDEDGSRDASPKANDREDDEDVEMAGDADKENEAEAEETPETSPPSTAKNGRTASRGGRAANPKATAAAAAGKSTPKSGARSSMAAVSASKSASSPSNDAQRTLPTRSGRATRSTAS